VRKAKAHPGELLRTLDRGPIVIQARGQDLGALVGIDTYQRLTANSRNGATGGRAFLQTIAVLKKRLGGGVGQFDPAPAVVVTKEPFQERRRR
jgi:prevent-host-death family protein